MTRTRGPERHELGCFLALLKSLAENAGDMPGYRQVLPFSVCLNEFVQVRVEFQARLDLTPLLRSCYASFGTHSVSQY
jgi:hypothetical protein